MANIGILSWLNEAALTPYPLQRGFGHDGFLLDANFVQFDNFVPILSTISLGEADLQVTLLIDAGTLTLSIPVSEITGGVMTKRLYDTNSRYVGSLTFGYDVLGPFDVQTAQTLSLNIPFLAHTVKSIPSKAGVYGLDGFYGDVVFSTDTNIFFDFVDVSNEVIFNAVAVPTYSNVKYLKTLNSVHPTLNSVYIKDSEILKITTPSTSTIQFSIVGANLADVLSKIGNTIVTLPMENKYA